MKYCPSEGWRNKIKGTSSSYPVYQPQSATLVDLFLISVRTMPMKQKLLLRHMNAKDDKISNWKIKCLQRVWLTYVNDKKTKETSSIVFCEERFGYLGNRTKRKVMLEVLPGVSVLALSRWWNPHLSAHIIHT